MMSTQSLGVTPKKTNFKKVASHNNMANPTSNSIEKDTGEDRRSGGHLGYSGGIYDIDKPLTTNIPLKGNLVVNYRNFQLQKESKSNLLNKDISNVLVICTGGTFCMVKTSRGYMV